MISASEFMSAAPAPLLNGNTSWASRYAGELKRVFFEHAAQAPRSLQRHLGPSELGVECDRQVAGKMAGIPTTNHVVDPWASLRGTAMHAWAAEAFLADNTRHGRMRWLAEQKVTPHPDHPGTADLYDAEEFAVVDHKFLGATTLQKIRRNGPSRHYRVQLLMYGEGYRLLGFPVVRVVLAAYPATAASMDGTYVWDLPHTEADNELLAEVYEQTQRRKEWADAIRAGKAQLNDVPASPSDDGCYFCPFFRPEAARDNGMGCPGHVGTLE